MKSRNKTLKELHIDKSYHLPGEGWRDWADPAHASMLDEGKFYREHMKFDLDSVADTGREFRFYGAHSCMFKIDSVTLEAIEDPSDGYRSYLDSVVVSMEDEDTPTGFFKTPIATVKIVKADESLNFNLPWTLREFDGWALVDTEDNHVWLLVGTDNSDDYYPGFAFHYEPKKNI